MKKQGLLFVSLISVLGFAADPTAVDVKTYLDQLQIKLDHAAQRINQPTAGGSSVTGLRGTKQTSETAPLYWKGKENKNAVKPEELKQFRAAVELARAGQKPEAVAALKTFQATYPQSALKRDVEETLQRLQ